MGVGDVAWLGIAVMGAGGRMVVAGFAIMIASRLRIIRLPFVGPALIFFGGLIWHYGSTIDK